MSELEKKKISMEMLQNVDVMWGLMKQLVTGQSNWRA